MDRQELLRRVGSVQQLACIRPDRKSTRLNSSHIH